MDASNDNSTASDAAAAAAGAAADSADAAADSAGTAAAAADAAASAADAAAGTPSVVDGGTEDIVFDSVVYTYDGSSNAIDDVSFAVHRGEYVAIVGGNGSGKSTIAKLINALYIPDAGTITVMGLSTADPDVTFDIRRRAGLVFQDPDNQMITSLVGDDVAFGPENLGLGPEEIKARVVQSLSDVGMSEFAERETYDLSGGQKQRVAIAGILAMSPDILVLDEPGAMLDPRGRRVIQNLTHELCDRGVTVVLVTHFMGEAIRAQRVIVMDHGKVALDGKPSDVFIQHEMLTKLRLEEPFSVQLTAELRERGVYVPFTLDEDRLQRAICLKKAICQ